MIQANSFVDWRCFELFLKGESIIGPSADGAAVGPFASGGVTLRGAQGGSQCRMHSFKILEPGSHVDIRL